MAQHRVLPLSSPHHAGSVMRGRAGLEASMRILVADKLPEHFESTLRAGGHECVSTPGLTEDTLADAVGDAEVLVVRSTKVTAATLAAADALRLVVRAGSGTNTIDCDEASRRGVLVANVPGHNAVAVAELSLGLLLARRPCNPGRDGGAAGGSLGQEAVQRGGQAGCTEVPRDRRAGQHRARRRRACRGLRDAAARPGQGLPVRRRRPAGSHESRHRARARPGHARRRGSTC